MIFVRLVTVAVITIIAVFVVLLIIQEREEITEAREVLKERVSQFLLFENVHSDIKIVGDNALLTSQVEMIVNKPKDSNMLKLIPVLFFKSKILFPETITCGKYLKNNIWILKFTKDTETFNCKFFFSLNKVKDIINKKCLTFEKINTCGCVFQQKENKYVCNFKGILKENKGVAFRNFIIHIEKVIQKKNIIFTLIPEKVFISVECKKTKNAVWLSENEKDVLKLCNGEVELYVIKIDEKQVELEVKIIDYNEKSWNVYEKATLKFWRTEDIKIGEGCWTTPYAQHCIEKFLGALDLIVPLER